MRLLVHVIGARDLPAIDLNGFRDPYVRLQLGKYRFRTKVVKKSLSPSWDEEFNFKADDLNDILTISVLDEDKYFNVGFLGKVKVPVSKVFDAERQTLASTWFPLQPKSKKSRNRDCGEILLTISLSQNNFELMPPVSWSSSNDEREKLLNPNTRESPSISYSGSTSSSTSIEMEEAIFVKEEKQSTPTFVSRLVQILLSKSGETSRSTNIDLPSTVLQEAVPDHGIDDNTYDIQSSTTYDEALKSIETRDQGLEMPDILPGVLLDQSYRIPPKALNSLLFAPDSTFMKSLAEFQGTTDVQEGPWRLENGGESLKRVVTYTNAATKLVKAVKAIEEQMYLKADGKSFAVFKSVSTPDVPYGSCFKLELLFCVMPGPELSSGDLSSHLVISWRMNFLQNTMMKGMIEGGARKGLKDSYEQFAKLLSQTVKPVGSTDLGSDKDQILADLQTEQLSDWKLAAQYFWNFTVLSTMFIGLYCFIHIILAMPRTMQGLEFGGLDLPDSIGEVLVCGILVLQGEQVLAMISHFMHARWQRGSDHGVRAQGDGWLLTVALIEGRSIASVDSTGFSDPYVVFTCNGKARTSSIKFQTVDPHWNEIFEFDAMDEPPSMLDVEIFNFDGPFDEATSLGHTEINFVKSNISELADIWIPLQGKLAQAWQSKLHVRIFLDNTKGNDVKEFLTKMEKEVGKKLNLRSPQTNSAFQKLFRLPPEEFLINDFTCHLKRKMVLQGRLFLSTRIIGFYSNLFGHKTKFFFLWEDIEDIKVIPPSLASVGSPSIVIILHRGRGMDAKHGAKTQDEEGRLKFHFQSFASFQAANRTIMALWKSKSLSPEEKVQIAEEESDARTLQTEGSASFLELEDADVSEIYSSLLPVPINSLMELFSGGHLDRQVMEKMDYLDYSFTPWELVKPDLFQRQLYYKFNKKVSQYGEVNCTQQKYHLVGRNGWVIEEVMTLQGIPLGDYFTLHIKYQIEDVPSRLNACNVQVYLGIEWLKNTRHRKRISKNLESKVAARQREIFKVAEMEIMVAQKQYSLQREHKV